MSSVICLLCIDVRPEYWVYDRIPMLDCITEVLYGSVLKLIRIRFFHFNRLHIGIIVLTLQQRINL
jgi:hypothetical protein